MEKYSAPKVELIKISAADIITTSGSIDLPEVPISKSQGIDLPEIPMY